MGDIALRVEGLGKRYKLGKTVDHRAMWRSLKRRLGFAAGTPVTPGTPAAPGTPGTPGTPGNAADADQPSEFWALKDVSFELKRGEVLGVIGRNGAGKSTLLKILSRIMDPTEGHAEIHGRVGSLLEVGTGFHPELTGRDNIYLNGSILGMTKKEIDGKLDEIVDFSGVEKFLDTPVKRYSSGMITRLGFAVAAHLEPEILIVDEVLAVGDVEFQRKCMGKMTQVASVGRTILFVSHSMPAIQSLCSTGLLLQRGQTLVAGSIDDVVSRYLADAESGINGYFNLRQSAARDVKRSPVVVGVRLRGGDGEQRGTFRSGETIEIDVEIEADPVVRDPRVAVAVEDSFGRRLMTAASYFQGEPLPTLRGSAVCRCTLDTLSLGPGRYLLSIGVNNRYEGVVDAIHNAAWFQIDSVNVFTNGEPYLSVYGPIIASSSWSVHSQ